MGAARAAFAEAAARQKPSLEKPLDICGWGCYNATTTSEVIRSAFYFLLNNLWGLRGSFCAAFWARKYDRIR